MLVLIFSAVLFFFSPWLSSPSFGQENTDNLAISAFSQLPQFTRPSLSPEGKRLAFIYNTDGDNPISVLSTLDLTTGKQYFLVVSDNKDVKIKWFNWANEETLVISARYAERERGLRYYDTRLFAMSYDAEGKQPKRLIKPRQRLTGNLVHDAQFQDNVIDWLRNDPEHILMAIDLDKANQPSVYKVNVNSGRMKRIKKGGMQIRQWITDQQTNLRVGLATDFKTGEREIFVKRTADGKLERLYRYDGFTEPGMYPIGFAKDPSIMYFRQYHNDKLALFTWNLMTDEQTLIFADENYDVDGSLLYSKITGDVKGISHAQVRGGRIYWDENYQAFEDSVDAVLPDTNNTIVSFSQDEQMYLVYAESDTKPGHYYLGNRSDNSMSYLFGHYPKINSGDISEHEWLKYTARDGMQIEGYLTLPKTGKAPYPTVMHPHGGPHSRDYDGFDVFTSFLTSQGYAVFRPNFRGSSGFGFTFKRSQMQAWGKEMQDDISDGALHLIEKGIADKDKFCIVGGSYGGYAAAMAAVKTPDLFSCAISFAGVTHLSKLIRSERRFLNNKFVKNQIGSDKDDLAQRSPISHIEKIKIPMLLIHGDEDRVVNVEQSRLFVDAMRDAGKSVEYIELEAGDHNLSIQTNRQLYFQSIAKFLQQHLSR